MRPSGKDNGLTYTVQEVKTGSGINLSFKGIDRDDLDRGGYGSPAMKQMKKHIHSQKKGIIK
jgi:hypothetical protein